MLYDIPVAKIDGKPTTLSEWNGNVLLIVNVASQCGLTPQYEQLEQIYDKYRAQGFAVLGFPANEFGAQEPGSNKEIQEFCSLKFGVKFPMFEKIVVKGQGIHPLYSELIKEQPRASGDIAGFRQDLKKYGIESGGDEEITWNFEKFLVDKSGHVVARFAPSMKPDDPAITAAIERELARPA
ncbi:MAG: glutathione peroxidase [Kofleriaceae bacterium]